ncbi:MAG: oligosaccharide flippase family protein [Parvibaculum sp.]|nr:oligosaccharide flippase family protein [Parvibaculum sp.]
MAGLYTNLMALSSTVSGLGMGSSGVRQVARSNNDELRRSVVLKALWLSGLGLGVLGGGTTYFLREALAEYVMGDLQYAAGVGWLGLGVAASVAGIIFSAIPQGLQRLGDFARINVVGNSLGSVVAVGIIWQFGASGIPYAVICLPIGVAAVAAVTVSRLESSRKSRSDESIRSAFAEMLRFGGVMLFTSILTVGTMMAVRSAIAQRMGLDVAGYFHAAWLMSATYISFLLSSMAADFYPRITAAVANGADPGPIIQDQMHFGIVLAGPLVVGIIAFAGPIILLLYSTEFHSAAMILHVQVLGDLLKVLSFPLGFTLLALGESWKYMTVQLVWNLLYFGIVLSGLEQFGVVIVGVAYLASYAVSLTLTFFMVRGSIDFRPGCKLKLTAAATVGLATVVSMLALIASAIVGYVAGAVAIALLGAYALHVVSSIPEVATRRHIRRLMQIAKALRSKILNDK